MVFPLDDAYITLDNARTLLSGFDPNYGQPALVGATSPINLAIVAGLGLILPLALASLIVNVAAAVGYAWGLWTLSGLGGGSKSARIAIVGVGLAAAIPHLLNGLETGMALAAIAWSLVLAARGSKVGLPLLLGALPFIRPDLAPWSAALLLWRAYRAGIEAGLARAGFRRLAIDLSFAAAAAAPWLAWTFVSLGTPFPSTMMAKRAFFAEEALPLGYKVSEVLQILLGSLLAPLILALVAARRAPLMLPICAALAAFFCAYAITLPGGLAHNHFRYLAIVTPFCLYGAAYAVVAQERLIKLGLVTLMAIMAPVGAFSLAHDYALTSDGAAAGLWAREHLPADARVLVHDAGLPAYETRLRLVDVVGLKSPASIPEHLRWTAPSAGRDRHEAVNRIALAAGVTHAIVHEDPFWDEIAHDLRRHGWTLNPLRTPSVPRGYWIYALTPPA